MDRIKPRPEKTEWYRVLKEELQRAVDADDNAMMFAFANAIDLLIQTYEGE